MFKRMKKAIVAVTVMGLMFTAFAPIGMVGKADASSNNSIDKVINVKTDATDPQYANGISILNNTNDTWATSMYFELNLPNGADWIASGYNIPAVGDASQFYGTHAIGAGLIGRIDNGTHANAAGDVTVSRISDKVVGVTINGAINIAKDSGIKLPLFIDWDSPASGEVKVTVNNRDSAVTGGSYTFAVAGNGGTTTTVDSLKTFSDRSATVNAIRIDETVAGSLHVGDKIKFKLPTKFSWVNAGTNGVNYKITGTGAMTGIASATFVVSSSDRDLYVTVPAYTATAARSSIIIAAPQVRVDSDAPKGDIVMSVTQDSGNGDITDQDVTLATYMDYGMAITVDVVENVVAGKYDNKTGKINFKESAANALVNGRDFTITLPEGVKFYNGEDDNYGEIGTSSSSITVTQPKFDNKTGNMPNATDWHYDKDANKIYFTVGVGNSTPSARSKYDGGMKFELSVAADFKPGDITAKIGGAGMAEQSIVIAKAVAPVTIDKKDMKDVRIGVKGQAAPNIVITETAKGMMVDDSTRALVTSTSDSFADSNSILVDFGNNNIKFAKTPTVKVLSGDVELKTEGIKRTNNNQSVLIPIKSTDTKVSSIEISDIVLDLDRTVAEGQFNVKIGGGAINKNYYDPAGSKNVNAFNSDVVVEYPYANVVTPAPGEAKSTSMFTIDSTTYKVITDGVTVEKTSDSAPFIQNGRTMLPLRAVATALGVSDDMIMWNAATHTAVVNKDGKLASVTVGSTVLDVNGMKITMDTAAVVKNGRLFLPVSFLATALGVTATWDAATKTVTFAE